MSTVTLRSPKVRTLNDQPPEVLSWDTDTSWMLGYLDEIGSAFLSKPIGQEVLIARRHYSDCVIDVTRAESRPSEDGSVAAGRLLIRRRADGPRILGALHHTIGTCRGAPLVILANVVVAKDVRGQGLAMRLLDELQADYANVRVGAVLTAEGAAFLGYSRPRLARPLAAHNASNNFGLPPTTRAQSVTTYRRRGSR